MGKGVSPLLGFNTNVRHKGKVFHIQTEDSGVQHPHIITHLFADGGRIIKSVKTPYGELLSQPDWETPVKKMMQDQHKAMFIALRDGQYDALIDPASARAASVAAMPAVRPSQIGAAPIAPASAASIAAKPAAPSIAAMPAARPSQGGAAAPAAPAAAQAARPAAAATAAATSATNSASAAASAANPAATSGAGKLGRYASVRTPDTGSAFGTARAESGNIFGESLMSEKSLDEVILAYLAEDLDDGAKR